MEKGEELAEVETAKSIITIVAPASGVLARTLVAEGEKVTADSQLGIIETPEPV